jgi:hypothetical protein
VFSSALLEPIDVRKAPIRWFYLSHWEWDSWRTLTRSRVHHGPNSGFDFRCWLHIGHMELYIHFHTHLLAVLCN